MHIDSSTCIMHSSSAIFTHLGKRGAIGLKQQLLALSEDEGKQMKYCFLASSLILFLCSAGGAQDASPQTSKLAWLAGCWTADDNSQTDEQWTKLAGKAMFGISRTIKDGQTASYEFMQIRETGSDIFYIAQPNGGQAVSFKLVKLNDSAAIFANDKHDFPQRIIYQRQIDGSMLAAIEGDVSGKAKRIEYPMKRVRCD